jgi:hypothetical protein
MLVARALIENLTSLSMWLRIHGLKKTQTPASTGSGLLLLAVPYR